MVDNNLNSNNTSLVESDTKRIGYEMTNFCLLMEGFELY